MLASLFDIQQKSAEVASQLYQTLRNVACGQSSCIDTADLDELKAMVQQLEQVMQSGKQYRDALEKLQQML